MTISEAAAIAHVFGKMPPNDQPAGISEHVCDIYYGLAGNLFNRFWENGVQGFLDGDDD